MCRSSRIVKRWRRSGHLSKTDQRVLTCALQNMRMSCNGIYLLDHETDHGTQVDELATLLGELFERPEAKAVIFSQWVRIHELVIRRLDPARFEYVPFHGGVRAEKHGELVERFHRDPAYRVFLSTDAGGVGLNLQHAASTVINMDLPWNRAVLEQRIGRMHRMGQTRSVCHELRRQGVAINTPSFMQTPLPDASLQATYWQKSIIRTSRLCVNSDLADSTFPHQLSPRILGSSFSGPRSNSLRNSSDISTTTLYPSAECVG